METLRIIGIIILIVVVLVVLMFAVINFDLMSYTATGSETLNPAGTSIGSALVVYSPGLSGAAKQAATIIAHDLQAKNYTVVLAGVRSGIVSDTSGYDLIVAGGPVYWAKVSSSIDGYLRTLPNNIRLGVFGTTGSSSYVESDLTSLREQVASDTHNEKAIIKLVLAGNETNDCADLVSTLMQQG
jgi:flavodoxin